MDIRLLGPFEVLIDGRRARLGGAKQRALLAILTIHANEVRPAERLIEELWPRQPPDSALSTLQGYVSRLRKALATNGSSAAEPLIVFRAPGYVLTVPLEQIDARRFERLLGEAEALAGSRDARGAAASLRQALGMWRGPPLAEFRYEEFAQAEIARLEELRLKAIEDRVDADLACGRHRALVPELEALAAEHPRREQFRAQLMLALYQCGRQAEALTVYRETRKVLSDELGIEPSPALHELERKILRQDPLLEPPRRGGPAGMVARLPRRVRIAVAGGAVVAAAVAVGFAVRPTGGDAVDVTVNSVAVVDPRSNEVVGDVRVGDYPTAVAAGNGRIWVANTGDNTVQWIDPETLKPSFSTGEQQPLDLAVTRSALWIAIGTSFQTNPPTGGGTIERRGLRFGATEKIKIGPAETFNEWWTVVTTDGRSVWAGNASTPTTVGLEPTTGDVVQRVAGVGGGGIAIGYGSVWVAEYKRNTVARIDPRGGTVIERIPVSSAPTRIAAGEGGVWVTTQHPHSAVWRISPRTGETVAVIPVPPTTRRIATGGGYVWVTSGSSGEPGASHTPGVLSKIDPRTDQIAATIKLGFRPDGVAFAEGRVWVAVAPE
jgi:DNA-binding SARP family transcriptional activator/streptogramin lyase